MRNWVRQAEIDGGARPGTTTEDKVRVAALRGVHIYKGRHSHTTTAPSSASPRPDDTITGLKELRV